MTRSDHRHPALRVSVPTLEPDDAFVARLAALAAASSAADPVKVSHTGRGWRAGLAAAGVATVLAGGGVVAAAVTGPDEAPSPPRGPVTPGEQIGLDPTPDGAEPSQSSPSTSPRDEDGSPGGSESAPVGSQDRAQDRAQDRDLDRDRGVVGPTDAGPGQAGQQHGQAGADHGQQDGKGDEVHGQDGLPHGQAGQQGRSDESPGLAHAPSGHSASPRGGPPDSGND